MEPHLQQEDVQHEQVLFLLQGALIILSKKNEAQEVTHPGAGGADNLQQEDLYCFAFDEILFTLNTRIIATFNGYPIQPPQYLCPEDKTTLFKWLYVAMTAD